MAVTDTREPGVYVTIEDASYVAPPSLVGRTVYTVGVCPKGPHNRVVEVTSQDEFRKLFGEPDFHKTTQTHYCMDAALAYTGKGLYVRVMPEDSTLANAMILEAEEEEESIGTSEEFTFKEDSDTVSVDSEVIDELSVGQWIYADDDEDDFTDARQIISIDKDENEITLDKEYTGSTSDWEEKLTTAKVYTPYEINNEEISQDTWYEEKSDLDSEVVYAITANGAGDYYNKLKIRGSRNIEMEKMYVDDDGEVKYPYLFMNIAVYEEKDDGTDRKLEGPWLVSLTKKNPEGATIRELSSGQILYIQEVVNQRSELIRLVAGEGVEKLALPESGGSANIEESNARRKHIMLLMSSGTPVGTEMHVDSGNAVQLDNGTNGTSDEDETVDLYSTAGNLQLEDKIRGDAARAFSGELTSIDGTIEQMREVTYPWFTPDYIVSGGWDAATQDKARDLAWHRQDCFHLGDSTHNVSASDDLDSRLDDVPWNHWTSMLYGQFRRLRDNFTGEEMNITPVYHAIQNHLTTDANYFIAEPVAGIEKGAITEPIKLAYKPNHTERGDLIDAEINPTIYEPDGIYFLTQFTTWKRLSILKRAHAAKFVAYVRKMVPPLLKDILQRKGTDYWINQAQFRVSYFLSKFKDSPTEAYKALDDYSVSVEFDDVASELNVYINMKPIRAIERINVFIIVE
ncbi:MAG: hypothetical protein ACOC80_12780 [Petrotogales bacterium]